jgi:hypothetical protein
MADSVTGPTIQYDFDKKLVTYCSVYSDGSGSSTTLVDVSALEKSTTNGNSCTHVALNKIYRGIRLYRRCPIGYTFYSRCW